MTQFKQLKKGEVLSETQFYTVEKIAGDKVQLTNDFGQPIVVNSDYVNALLTSAVQVTESKNVTRTELATLFLTNPYVAMEANFNKQVKALEVVKEIMKAYESSTPKEMETAVKKTVKQALEGEERIIRGRHTGHKDEFGRVTFIDMEIPNEKKGDYDSRSRLVDPRTLNSLIIRGIKYVAK